MSASMAAVLAEHHWYEYTKNLGYYRSEYKCECGADFWAGEHEGDPTLSQARAAHVAKILAASGYGNLEDAKAAALREAALELVNVSEHDSRMPGIRFAVGFLAGARSQS